jgi:DNA (cytosine-5)-methyltransferase 1
MDAYTKKTRDELIAMCKEQKIKGYSSLKKGEIIQLLQLHINSTAVASSDHSSAVTSNATSISEEDKITKFKFIDLFCGIGGFHQALTNINGECVFACDIDEKCREIYEENYKLKPSGDITTVDIDKIPAFDVLCGGFPCQPFSKAGQQKGFNDDRGNLFFNICSIVKRHNPKYLLLENVRNLSSHDDGNTWKVIYENIDKLGYYTYKTPVILNVLHFNIPQNRERVIIMCKRKDLGELPLLPSIPSNPKLNLTQNISDFICSGQETEKYKLDGKLKDVETIWNSFIMLLIENDITMPKFPIWTDWWDNNFQENDAFYVKYTSWIDKNREFYNDNKNILEHWLTTSRENANWLGAVRKFEWQAGDLLPDDGMHRVLWSARGSGIRVKRCNYIPTLVAMSMVPVYGPEHRKLTPRELLRLQSFPDSFKFNEKTIHKQVGNAVNVKMIQTCAKFLMFNDILL